MVSMRSLFKVSVVISTLCAGLAAQAVTLATRNNYYGEDFYNEVSRGARDQALISNLQKVLESRHLRHSGAMDTIDNGCDTATKDCYAHQSLGYNTARKLMMGQIYLNGGPGNYAVKDVYCEKTYTNSDFGGGNNIGPNTIPKETVLNTEHTWPQSRFPGRYSKDTMKSDLHHLYPTETKMNAIRGNKKFGEVAVPAKALPCPTAKFGSIAGRSDDYFEPPTTHKGNVARSLFYFSVRYHISIDSEEEAFLRKWHQQDPPDAFEIQKNETIYKAQGDRNPFIDHPELVSEISDF